MNEQEYHETLAGRFKTYAQGSESVNSVRVQQAKVLQDFRRYVPDRNARILDVGCHEGIGLKILRRWHYKRIEGVEYLSVLVRAAQRKKCRVQQGDAHNLPFKDSEFDAIYSRYVLEHCHTPSQVVREMTRVLKPGGVIYITVSSEIESGVTQQGITVFKTMEDFKKIILTNLNIIRLETSKTKMGWYDIVFVAKVIK